MNNLSKKTRYMVRLSIFVALEILLALTPLGYLHAGVLEISLMMIPVVVGGVLLGPGAGAFLGGVFGITSFLQCFGMSAFGAVLLGINGFFTFLVCVPTRILAGWLPALLYRSMTKNTARTLPAQIAACLCGPILNTLFFMSSLMLLFGQTEAVGFVGSGMSLLAFMLAFVGINTAVEIPATAIVGTAVSKALEAAEKNSRKKDAGAEED